MKLKNYFSVVLLAAFTMAVNAQDQNGPTSVGVMQGPIYVKSIAQQTLDGTLKLANDTPILGHPKRQQGNQVIPGKGLPNGDDPLRGTQLRAETRAVKAPILVFDADISQATPSDPTGAVGPNHYVAAWNVAFRIFDKAGTPLTPEMSLATIFPGNAIGDPIVFYDEQADRFVITEFDSSPNGFNVAVSQGSNPVTSGWNVYTTGFGTGAFPDYTKFAVWADSYVVTANIGSANRVFAVERNQMIAGNASQFVALPLPGIATNGFYSPHGFHTTAGALAPIGTPAPIVYLQDDAWGGVTSDHLKVWSATINWAAPGTSTMSAPQIIPTAAFTSVFDGGSFQNRPQGGGVDVDILQATMMNQVNYRRFPTYNSAVMNFVVDVLAGSAEKAAIRWYELRQVADGLPWTIYQEGTYEAPDGRDAYAGSIAMNSNGDIGMGYTSSSAADRISIRYTGQLAGSPLNVMNSAEGLIEQSTGACPNPGRLADYVQISVDPVNQSFWHIAEYFKPNRRDVVGNFNLEPVLGVSDFAIDQAQINVNSLPNNQFEITLTTDFDGILALSVYNILGETVVFNNLSKEGNGYNYNLDMSYAATGVYVIKMGSEASKSFKTAKIIVK